MTVNILLVEDDPELQKLLVFIVTQCGYRAIQAVNTASAMTHVSNSLPDLILLDWKLHGSTGIELARRLRADKRTRDIPIIMVTARNNESDKVLGLESGADDYITKPFSPRELMARIRAKLRRFMPQKNNETVRAGGLELSPSTQQVSANGTVINLGATEYRVLHFLLTRPECVISRSQLLDQVWGDQVFVEERTVDVHIRRLRQALKPAGLAGLVETVRGSGYRFRATINPQRFYPASLMTS